MKRFLWLGFVLSLYVICTGCGETFRPIIIPNPPTFPNPKAAHTVVSINHNFECFDALCDNGTVLTKGSAMVIDVSGDTDVSIADVNLAPVHAVQQSANQILVLNQAVTGLAPPQDGSCLINSGNLVLNVCPSISKLGFNGTFIAQNTTISLPASSAANFVAVAPLDTTAYVSLPNFIPNPIAGTVVPSVGVINTQLNNLIATIPVGNNPFALAVTPDKTKLYVANNGDSTISGFNTSDRSQRTGSPVATSSAPIWLIPRGDNQRVYVLESNGGLEWLDTTSTAGPDVLTPTGISVPGATRMVYDSNKNRLYIPGGPILKIVDVSQSVPQVLATISLPNIPELPSSVPASAVAVAALPDGSRAYVASVPSTAQSSQVTISGVQGDGQTATYTYTWTGGHDLTKGISVDVSGIAAPNDGFNGTYVITAVSGTSCNTQPCTFQAANSTVLTAQTAVTGAASSTFDSLFPQVTVIDVPSNTIKTTIGLPGFPDATIVGSPYYAPICATTRFRFMMAAGGDSSRAYLSSCDGGAVNIIDTAVEGYVLSMPAPVGSRAPIGTSTQNPPQNPVFLIAGP